MLPPIPWCSRWAQSSLNAPSHFNLPRYGSRVGPHIVLFEACSAFTRGAACTLARSQIRDTLIEGFSHFVTFMTAPIASGWSDCRVGFAPTGKRRLCTAHANRKRRQTSLPCRRRQAAAASQDGERSASNELLAVFVTRAHHLGQRSPTLCGAQNANWRTERAANSVRPAALHCRYPAKIAALPMRRPSAIAAAAVTRWSEKGLGRSKLSGMSIRRETVVRLPCCSAIWSATPTSLRCWMPKMCMPCWNVSLRSLMRLSTALAGRLTSTSATRQWRCSEHHSPEVMMPSGPCAPLWRYRLPFQSSHPAYRPLWLFISVSRPVKSLRVRWEANIIAAIPSPAKPPTLPRGYWRKPSAEKRWFPTPSIRRLVMSYRTNP